MKKNKTNNGKTEKLQGQNGKTFDPMALTWSERYDEQISKVWKLLPESVAKIIASVAVFILGVSINGDWILVWVHLIKQFGHRSVNATVDSRWFTLESLRLNNFLSFWWPSLVVSYGLYVGIGGFIHWYYYIRQRDRPEEWKCQPQKWLSPELEKHEILLGSFTLFLNATVSSLLSCYIYNGGYCTVYYDISEYGWLYFILQFPLIFIYQDYLTYWLHRIYHLPFLYKNFHKLHHKYKQPTAFSVTAIHPVESLHIQITLATPLFFAPIHWFPFYASAFYAYYHGIIDHSGVNFKSFWWQPWQPDAIFHDNHHQYFHVNFAFNISFWDKLHGTYRRKDRVYNEDIFYGTGKTVDSVTSEELAADLEERELENPLAYRAEMPFKLSDKEVKSLRKSK
ncbi:methylsterol monooxygenase 1-like [Anthonomus grandis grandis]|uniref:methylsterol monooxygenase 1-like n=1 Tax=Anthonomus grandis grandis TaxID=2921223 RepID=UPI002165E7D3|nr:methylsterol monooxygenase 1-like [Anthonomus grandis grandis]